MKITLFLYAGLTALAVALPATQEPASGVVDFGPDSLRKTPEPDSIAIRGPSDDASALSDPGSGYKVSLFCQNCFNNNGICLTTCGGPKVLSCMQGCKDKTIQKTPKCGGCVGWAPWLHSADVEARDDVTCDDCSGRFHTCVNLAGVSGLPNCEAICRQRAQDSSGEQGVCQDCDASKFYPNGTLPPKSEKRGVASGAAELIAHALYEGLITERDMNDALNEVLDEVLSA